MIIIQRMRAPAIFSKLPISVPEDQTYARIMLLNCSKAKEVESFLHPTVLVVEQNIQNW